MGQCCEKELNTAAEELKQAPLPSGQRKSLIRSSILNEIHPADHVPASDYASAIQKFEPIISREQKIIMANLPNLTISKLVNSSMALLKLPDFYKINDGRVYQGSWLYGIPHGRGIFFCEDHIYEG
jgi:hypothetical protein